jgi:hypothetical protein
VQQPQKYPDSSSTSKAKRQMKNKRRPLTPFLALVAMLEFDGRRLYHRKEHRLALHLVPNSAKSPICVRSYVHFSAVK